MRTNQLSKSRMIKCLYIFQKIRFKKSMKWPIRDHPFKTSACLRGGGGSPVPMVADARGAGVLGLPTSAIFESIRRRKGKKSITATMLLPVENSV